MHDRPDSPDVMARRRAIPEVTVPRDSEEARSFLQARLALVGRVASLLAGVFWLVQNAVAVARPDFGLADAVVGGGNPYHLGALGVMAATWLATRGARVTDRILVVIDALALPIVVALFSLGMVHATADMRPDVRNAPQLAAAIVALTLMMFRAAFVPSPPSRTLVASALMGTAPVVVALVAHAPGSVVLRTTYVLLWMIIGTTITTLTSRALYGLRAMAREARKLGQYTLKRKLGEGGMGEVYVAEHALLRRPTAIKLLHPDKVDAEHLARFEREVQLTAELTHPNTITVYDYGRTAKGIFYYAMEYLDGIDLQNLVERYGPQPAGRVVGFLSQIAGSLAEAHARGLIHRDIKPANLVVCERPEQGEVVKVLDFGLAKSVARTEDVGASASRSATIVGTPHYLAPETILGAEVGPAADLYALGAVAFFLLTGQTPLDGETTVAICAAHLHQTPDAPSARLGTPLPDGLDALVLACLAKAPEGRPPSATALALALHAIDVAPFGHDEIAAFWSAERERSRPARESLDDALDISMARVLTRSDDVRSRR